VAGKKRGNLSPELPLPDFRRDLYTGVLKRMLIRSTVRAQRLTGRAKAIISLKMVGNSSLYESVWRLLPRAAPILTATLAAALLPIGGAAAADRAPTSVIVMQGETPAQSNIPIAAAASAREVGPPAWGQSLPRPWARVYWSAARALCRSSVAITIFVPPNVV
jgi:hypothetical protein